MIAVLAIAGMLVALGLLGAGFVLGSTSRPRTPAPTERVVARRTTTADSDTLELVYEGPDAARWTQAVRQLPPAPQ